MTLGEMESLRDDLQRAIYSGALEVRFGDRWIKYQHSADMRQALSDLKNDIALAGTNQSRSMSTFVRFNG